MPDRHRLSEPQARAHARAWLAQQHTDAHELLVTLLHYVPEPDRTRALRELSTGELRHLARLLADATDLRQVARAIVADLQRHLPTQQKPNSSQHPASPSGDRYDPSITTCDRRFVTRRLRPARQALRSDRHPSGANRNSRASTLGGLLRSVRHAARLACSGCCYVPLPTPHAEPVTNRP